MRPPTIIYLLEVVSNTVCLSMAINPTKNNNSLFVHGVEIILSLESHDTLMMAFTTAYTA